MEIYVVRKIFDDKSTISNLSIEDEFECNVLEDTNRERFGLPVLSWKIFGETCIPCGRYEVVWSYSLHFKKNLLQLLNVPGFDGVRLHCGNKPNDTEGCLLVGFYYEAHPDWIGSSHDAYDKIIPIIDDALKSGEKVFVNISVDESRVQVF